MAKAETFQDLALKPRRDGEERWRWLYGELRAAILEGRLKAGARMPSTRSLAAQYDLSRGTIVVAFEQLRSEGYVTAESGAGTFVASGLPDRSMVAKTLHRAPALPRSTASLSKRGRTIVDGIHVLPPSRSMGKAFRLHEPAIDLFPIDLWSRVAGRVLRRVPRSLYGQGDVAGYLPLRKAIAEYVGPARGVRCEASQVIVTSGAQQALDLVARILLDPEDRVWLEDPGYPGARAVFRGAGAELVPVPVDDEGLDLRYGLKQASTPKVVYTTPANEFPLGITMSLDRRLALLKWAAEAGVWIVEDDYDAEYRYSGRPLAALQSLDRSGCVVYIGTFTKLLFNALRVGFLIVPERVVDAFQAVRSFVDRHHPTLDQAILAEFIHEGHFGHHVRRMRQTYAERMSTLLEAGRKEMVGLLEISEAHAGMRTLGWLQTRRSDAAAAQKARAYGLELAALSEFSIRHFHAPALLLGFAACSAAELRRGISVLATALSDTRS